MAGARVVVSAVAAAPELGAAVGDELERRAARWAAAVGDAMPAAAGEPPGEAIARLFAEDAAAPVLLARAVLPAWPPGLADAALGDLAAGCDASFGPLFDGGCYLIALARPVPALLALDDGGWDGADPIGQVARAAIDDSRAAPVGLLRTERGLRTAADVRALLADPLLDGELRRLLG